MLNCKVLVAVPTYNRPQIVRYLLEKTSSIFNCTKNLYLGIYDSSTDEETCEIVENYVGEKIKYKKYDAGLSEEKGYEILKEENSRFDYIWFCSDRKVLKLNYLLDIVENDLNKGVDLVLFSNMNIDGNRQVITERNCIGMLFFEILNMAKTIIGKSMFSHMLRQEVFWKYYGSHFSIQASAMDYIGCNDSLIVQYNLRDQDIAETGAIPFVHEWGNNVVCQWSKNWCDTVDNLPASFDGVKGEMIKMNTMFSFKKVLARRATGNEYHYADIRKYKEYIGRIQRTKLPLYFARLVPVFMIRAPYRLYKYVKTSHSVKA